MANIYENQDPVYLVVLKQQSSQKILKIQLQKRRLQSKHVKDSEEQKNKDTKRIIEKVKKMRQNFSKAIIKGSTSESEKFKFEF